MWRVLVHTGFLGSGLCVEGLSAQSLSSSAARVPIQPPRRIFGEKHYVTVWDWKGVACVLDLPCYRVNVAMARFRLVHILVSS